MSKRLWIGCSLLAAIALLLFGCQQRPSVEEIVAKMKEVEASTEDVHAVVELSLNDRGENQEIVIELWEKRNKYHADLLESTSDEFAPGSAVVNDGTQLWIYDPAHNQVVIGQAGAEVLDDIPFNPRDALRLLDEILQWGLDHGDVKLAGEEDVTGIPTYKIEFTPKEGEDMPLPVAAKGTMWVDQDRWIVLQARFVIEGLSEGFMLVRSFELNSGISDDLFRFEIPDGVKVVRAESLKPVHLTLDEAQTQAAFLLVPAYVPEGVTLVDVFATNGAYVFHYDHSATTFTLMQSKGPIEEQPRGRVSEVSVRGQAATLIVDELEGNSFLTWTENGISIVIAGHIDRAEILRVAESLQ